MIIASASLMSWCRESTQTRWYGSWRPKSGQCWPGWGRSPINTYRSAPREAVGYALGHAAGFRLNANRDPGLKSGSDRAIRIPVPGRQVRLAIMALPIMKGPGREDKHDPAAGHGPRRFLAFTPGASAPGPPVS